MIAVCVTVVVVVMLLVAAWLLGPLLRSFIVERRQLQVIEAQLLAEQRIRAATQATLAAMRSVARRHLRDN